ncbi:hypothetical protein Tco_0493127 [Tanacetum coccineum]
MLIMKPFGPHELILVNKIEFLPVMTMIQVINAGKELLASVPNDPDDEHIALVSNRLATLSRGFIAWFIVLEQVNDETRLEADATYAQLNKRFLELGWLMLGLLSRVADVGFAGALADAGCLWYRNCWIHSRGREGGAVRILLPINFVWHSSKRVSSPLLRSTSYISIESKKQSLLQYMTSPNCTNRKVECKRRHRAHQKKTIQVCHSLGGGTDSMAFKDGWGGTIK